ncbi:ABC transporter permease [Ensifer soli]|uniref:ABC transporter permease n=1 Tax=Ciceribacter sp. sgz301302 TaxID=3342379 RepID=UPI0035B886F0
MTSQGSMSRHRIMPLSALLAVLTIALIVAAALLAPWIATNPPQAMIGDAFAAPGGTLLGTDVLGRDLFSRIVHGARLTLLIAVSATVIGFAVGTLWAFVAAELDGWFNEATEWLVNILLSFPPLMLGLLLVSALSNSLPMLIGAIAAIQVPRVVRVARAVAQNVIGLQFVEVARARGERLPYILLREVLPNCLRPLAAEFGLRLTYSTLFISGLSFLGLGVQPPDADWGGLVRENMSAMQIGAWMPVLAPAMAIGAFAVSLNVLIDWIDSRSSTRIG